jgi:hypothetical protein
VTDSFDFVVPVSVENALPAVVAIWAYACVAGGEALARPVATVISGPVIVAGAGFVCARSAGIHHTLLTVVSRWSLAAVANWIALSCVLRAVLSRPVVIANTEPVIPAVGIVRAPVAVLMFRAKAGGVLVAVSVTCTNKIETVFTVPVRIAYAVSVVIVTSVVNARFAVARTGAEAAVTFVVTESLEHRAIIPSPPIITLAVSHTIHTRMMYASLTLT